jgi:hypothetical protein
MITYEVENRDGFIAALRAVAQSSYDEAKLNPFCISLVGTSFKLTALNGMHERGAERIIKQIKHTPKQAFKVAV